jgi:hypothetical protein
MFDSLADRMREDEKQSTNRTQRIFQWGAVVVLSVVLFGGLYLGVQFIGN